MKRNLISFQNLICKTNKMSFTKISKLDSMQNNFNDKIGLIITLEDKPGNLVNILNMIAKENINISYICSKPGIFKTSNQEQTVDMFIDLHKENNEGNILKVLTLIQEQVKMFKFSNLNKVPWFPKNILDLNLIGSNLKLGGDQLQSDHPGFNDIEYKNRRTEIESNSSKFKFNTQSNFCEPVVYTEEEQRLWTFMWDQLIPLQRKYACDEFNSSMNILISEKVFSRDKIPQFNEMNEFFEKRTQMFFRPTGGLLSEREFLNSLAFNVFPSTQYIRHKSKPLYTPEPDIIHEFLGHAATFANKDFTEFSQEIGLASLGVNDEEIQKLATIYWYTIEFGLCKQNNEIKIYGGGILSSPSEIMHSVTPSNKCKYLDFDLRKISSHPVDICNIQTEYFIAPSFKEMKKLVKEYKDNIKRSFNVSFDLDKKIVEVDRNIVNLI